jgi:uncharacterized protein (DUF1778 family)
MTVSKRQQGHVNAYIKNNYDRINLTLPKGAKEELRTAAAARGQSVNQFIQDAIEKHLKASD